MKALISILLSLSIYFTFAQTGPGGVGDSTTNVLWLRSDDINQADGTDIATWTDFSGNSNSVTQADNTLNPVFITTDVVNGFPVVRFNKVNNRIVKENFTDFPTTAITSFIVNKNDGESGDGILSYASSGAYNNDFLNYGSNHIGLYIRNGSTNTGIDISDNSWHIASTSWRDSDNLATGWKDGDHTFSGSINTTAITAGGCLAIAGEQDSVNGDYQEPQTHTGDFTEVILYNTFLNDSQQIIVNNYLSAKYDTPLAANDFYIQDNNAQGDFDYNVAGIGQAADGSSHTDSQGTGIIRINTPSSLSNDDYLFWGEDKKVDKHYFTRVDEFMRLNTTWRVSKQNDLGTVTVSIDKADLSGMTKNSNLKLIVSNNNTFATKTTYDLTLSGSTYTATGVNFTDNDYFTIEFNRDLGYIGPGGVGNEETLALWVRAEDITLADGDNITNWADFSGNNNDLSQTDNLYNPVFKTNIPLNGYPVVHFGKDKNRIVKTNFEDFPSGEITAIYVNKNDGETNEGILSYASTAHDNNFLLFGSGSLRPHISFTNNTSYNSGVVVNDNNWHIVNYNWRSTSGVNSETWKDNDKLDTNTDWEIGQGLTKNGTLAIGCDQDAIDGGYSSSQTHTGDFTEIIFYNTALNDSEHCIVNNYLSAKYDKSLAVKDFYNQDDNTQGDFDFNVAGIGQATDGSNHIDSQGTGVIRINTPSALANDDYLFWGENVKDATYEFATTSEYTERLNTTWRVSKQNDLGTVTLSVNNADIDLAGKTSCAPLKLILSSNANFSNKTSYDMTLSNGIYTTTNVNFTDGDYFTFEYFDKIVVDDTKFYNGSGASNVPDISDGCYKLLVKNTANGTLPLTENCVVREVEVETGGVLVVNNAIDFEVTNGIQLDGEIRMIGNAQLNQTHTGTSQVTGNGKLYIDQTSNLTNVYQSGYWSSPVVTSGNTYTIAGAMKDGSTPTSKDSNPPNINFISGYNGATTTPISISNFWLAKLTNALDWNRHRSENTAYNPTEGYNMKSSGANHQNYTFVGKPNDGDYTSTITSGNSSLLGNPYPGAMDANEFLSTNSTLFNTLYFWDGSNDNSNTHVRSAYAGGYATYSSSLGTAYNGGTAPNGIIAVGQGFFVDATATGTIVFNNNHRIYDTTGHLYARPTVLQTLRLGLDFEVSATETFHRQLALAFRGDLRGLDNHDAPMYDFRPTDFSVIVEGQTSDYVITGEPNFNDDLEIPLHVKLDQQRELSFKIDALENFAPNNVYLKDNNTGMYYDLANPISINVEAGDYHDRFSITFTNSVAAINNITKDNYVTIIDNVDYLALNSNLPIKQIAIYNTLGQELVNETSNSSQINLPVKLAKNSVVFVVVKLENAQVITKKMVKK